MSKAANTQPFYKGHIPADWTVATFGELFEFLKTFSFSREQLTDEPTESGIQYIHYGDIHSKFSGGILDFESNPGVPYLKDGVLDAKALGKKDFPFLRDGDLVIADASEDYEGIGQCVVLRGINGRKVVAGLHTIAARPRDSRMLEGFSGYTIQHPQVTNEFRRIANGISVFGISKANTEKLKLCVPKLDEQKFISAVLSTCDERNEKSQRLLEIKRQALESLKNDLYRYSYELGSLAQYGDFLKESSIRGKTGNHARKISISLYGKGVYANIGSRVGSERTQYFIRRKGQLVYSKLDFLNGAFGIVPHEFDGFESTQDLPAFDIDPRVDPMWLLEYLIRPAYYTRQTGLARGQRKARRVNPSDFLKSTIRLPPIEFQRLIGAILREQRREIEILTSRDRALYLQGFGLKQKLLTGKWRVQV